MIRHVSDPVDGSETLIDLELVGFPPAWLWGASPWAPLLRSPESLWLWSEFPSPFFGHRFMDSLRQERQEFRQQLSRFVAPKQSLSLDKIWREDEFLQWLQKRSAFYGLPSVTKAPLESLREFARGLPLMHPPLIGWLMYLPFVLAKEFEQAVPETELGALAQWRAALSCEGVPIANSDENPAAPKNGINWWLNPSWQSYSVNSSSIGTAGVELVWVQPHSGQFATARCQAHERDVLEEIQALAVKPKNQTELEELLNPLPWDFGKLIKLGLFWLG